MRRAGIAVLLIGVVLALGSCTVFFPSQYGSDYAAINLGGPAGTLLGVILICVGAVTIGTGGRSTKS